MTSIDLKLEHSELSATSVSEFQHWEQVEEAEQSDLERMDNRHYAKVCAYACPCIQDFERIQGCLEHRRNN